MGRTEGQAAPGLELGTFWPSPTLLARPRLESVGHRPKAQQSGSGYPTRHRSGSPSVRARQAAASDPSGVPEDSHVAETSAKLLRSGCTVCGGR